MDPEQAASHSINCSCRVFFGNARAFADGMESSGNIGERINVEQRQNSSEKRSVTKTDNILHLQFGIWGLPRVFLQGTGHCRF